MAQRPLRLSQKRILEWADAHRVRTGDWPVQLSGACLEAGGMTWSQINKHLTAGRYGLRGGTSLARLLKQHRGKRNKQDLPRVTIKQILAWADASYTRHGDWPRTSSGPIEDAPGETWNGVSLALARGHRGLPGGSSLARLLAKHRGKLNLNERPRLTIKQILAWADAYHRVTGGWPTQASGPIDGTKDEKWGAISQSLGVGARGLRGGGSLVQLLHEHRGMRNHMGLPKLTKKQVVAWADSYRKRMGKWPTARSGTVHEAPDENWRAIDTALREGVRGFAGGDSVPRVLDRYRRNRRR